LPADAAAGDGRQRQDIEAAEFSAGRQLQIPAIGGGGVESADIRELAIEFVDDGLRLGEFDAETAAVGENQALLVQAQMHRVGAQPAGVGGGRAASRRGPGKRRRGTLAEAEGVAEGRFEATVADDGSARLRAISVFRPGQGRASRLSRSSGSGQTSSGTTRVSCMRAGGLDGGGRGLAGSRAAAAAAGSGNGSHCRKSVA
jgi:hypothetical protein